MQRAITLLIITAASCAVLLGQNWPTFRGPGASGVAADEIVPISWNAKTGSNILWKTPIPGLAHSSPVIWKDRIFLTTAVRGEAESEFQLNTDDIAPVKEDTLHRWYLYCLDKLTGRVLWQRTVHEGIPRVKRHLKASQSNSTPATDGRVVVAIFGSEGVHCFDMSGKLIWKADLGILDPGLHDDPTYQWGHASSPVLHGNLAIVQSDGHSQSFLSAFDLRDGKVVWSVPRGEMPSWSTPTLYAGKARTELITTAPAYIRGYDPETGKELWKLSNGDLIVQVPTPLVGDGLIYTTGGWPGGRPIQAIRAGGSGDLSPSKEGESSPQVVWRSERGGPYVPSPILYGEYLYVCNDRGVMSCYHARTGELLYQHRINNQSIGFSASPVAAQDRLYLASEDGDVFVVKAGPVYELLSINPIDEPMMATPAISEGMIFIRGRRHLFAVADPAQKVPGAN